MIRGLLAPDKFVIVVEHDLSGESRVQGCSISYMGAGPLHFFAVVVEHDLSCEARGRGRCIPCVPS